LNATPEDRDDAVLRRIDADNRYALAGSTGSGGLSQDVHGTVNLPAKSSTQGSEHDRQLPAAISTVETNSG